MQRIITILLCSLLPLLAEAAGVKDGVEFDSYSWDFGKIQEKDGIVSHTFVLTNATGKAVQIGNAIPSCSCTFVGYPTEVIPAGGKAEIEVKYTPSGSMGKVFREIQVYDGANNLMGTLEISADVEPMDRAIPERYLYTLSAGLYASLNQVPFGYVYHGTEKTKIIYLANSSDKEIEISIDNPDDKLLLKFPSVIAPGQEVELEMTYSTPDQPDYYAYVVDSLYFYADGVRSLIPVVTSMIALDKMETGASSSALRTYPSAPRLKKKGKAFVARIDLYSDGDDPLEVHAIQLPEFVTANVQRGESIQKGRKRVLELTSQREQDFTICLFTNDPVRPMKEIRVTKALK